MRLGRLYGKRLPRAFHRLFWEHAYSLPANISRDEFVGNMFTQHFSTIHLAGWSFEFPSHTEQLLWRGASLLLGLLVLYLIAIGLGILIADRFARFFFKTEVQSILEVASLLPKWAQIAIHVPIIAAYVIARTYIIVERPVSLRALPRSAYESVNWTDFFPHL